MNIGIPKETKLKEFRVSVTPYGVRALAKEYKVFVEKSCGETVGFFDEDYVQAGAVICESAEEVYEKSDMIVKVNAPLSSEYHLLKKNQILFASLNLADNKELTTELLNKKITSISYENIQKEDGTFPLMLPMSEIAGKMSVQLATDLLQTNNSGAGVLLGGVTGVPSGTVLIIGAGTVGFNAARAAFGLGADVYITDINIDKLRKIENTVGLNVKTFLLNEPMVEDIIKRADAVICAIHLQDKKLPIIITEQMVKSMKKGSVIIDTTMDKGGVVETMDRITTIDTPYFEKYGIIHSAVDNIPNFVSRTSTIAVTNALMKYLLKTAEIGVINAIKEDKELAKGVVTFNGAITNPDVAETLNKEYTELSGFIGF